MTKYWPEVEYEVTDPEYTSFWEHEWSKHGTCSGLSQDDYFQTTVNLIKSFGHAPQRPGRCLLRVPAVRQRQVPVRRVHLLDPCERPAHDADRLPLRCAEGRHLHIQHPHHPDPLSAHSCLSVLLPRFGLHVAALKCKLWREKG
eukprot:Colp12_sorted_trinity150504_noHs@23754